MYPLNGTIFKLLAFIIVKMENNNKDQQAEKLPEADRGNKNSIWFKQTKKL